MRPIILKILNTPNTFSTQNLHIRKFYCTFAVDLVKRYQSLHILLTALAIISHVQKPGKV